MFRYDSETNIMSVIRKDTVIFNIALDNYTLDRGDSLLFTVAKGLDLPKDEATITALVDSFESGGATVILDSTMTDIEAGTYFYDIQITTRDGRVDTVIGPAKFKVLGGVSY